MQQFWKEELNLKIYETQGVKAGDFDAPTVWLEIISVIKGSYNSHRQFKKYLAKHQYLNKKKRDGREKIT